MMWFFRHFWIFISYHIFLLNQVEGAIAIPPSNSAPLPLFCPSVCPSVCPSIGLLTTFSGFCTFADKSLGRNGIELEMQMFPDDLPLANIDADGYCCHFMRSSVRSTIHGLGFVYCIQSAWKKWPTIWHADVSRWLTLSIHGCLWILLLVCLSVHLSVCSFTAFSGGCAFADKSLGTNGIKFGAKEGGSHYWEMAVAITCVYGGYLLPLLAAHSSFLWYFIVCKLGVCLRQLTYSRFLNLLLEISVIPTTHIDQIMVNFTTHYGVTRQQWVNTLRLSFHRRKYLHFDKKKIQWSLCLHEDRVEEK